MRRIQVECIAFRKKSGVYEFLLLKRIPKKGGFWQPPGGGFEEGDATILDAAYRELWEETGITKEKVMRIIKDVHKFEVKKHYLTGATIPTITEHVYGFEVRKDIRISIDSDTEKEHVTFRWATLEQALNLLKWENNKTAFKKLYDILNAETS
ncbi:MAG: NUDIX domain-containing protein [Candidatus Woesearchaeota archaeon]